MEGMELLRGSEGEMEMLTATLGIKILAPPPCDKFQSQLPAKPGLEMLGPCPFRPVQRKGCARLDSPGNASPPGAGQPVARWLSSHRSADALLLPSSRNQSCRLLAVWSPVRDDPVWLRVGMRCVVVERMLCRQAAPRMWLARFLEGVLKRIREVPGVVAWTRRPPFSNQQSQQGRGVHAGLRGLGVWRREILFKEGRGRWWSLPPCSRDEKKKSRWQIDKSKGCLSSSLLRHST